MTKTPELDRAIEADDNARQAYQDKVRFGEIEADNMEEQRWGARALVAELLRGIDPENEIHSVDVRIGWDAALDEIRRIVGIVEGEG